MILFPSTKTNHYESIMCGFKFIYLFLPCVYAEFPKYESLDIGR